MASLPWRPWNRTKNGHMIKRCIGIDIGPSHLRAVQVARTPEGLFMEKAFGMQTRRSTDSVPTILRSLVSEHGFERRAEVAVSMPSHTVVFAAIRTDAAGLQEVCAGQTLALRDDLPIPVEDAVVRICSTRALPDGTYGVLVAATTGETLREQLQLFQQAHMDPAVVDASIVAACTTLMLNHPELAETTGWILCVDESMVTLAVVQEGDILIVRNIPVPSDPGAESPVDQVVEVIDREVEITWRKLFGTEPDKELCVFLISAPDTAERLCAALQERIECRIVIANPYANVGRLAGGLDFPVCVAEGLALRALADGPTDEDDNDFLAAYNARTQPGRNIRKELIACAALLALTAIIWFAGLFVQLSTLESQHARLKQQIHNAFRQALPEEKNIVNPLAQLQQKLDAFQQEYTMTSSFRPGRFSPLEIMHMLTVHTPREGNLKFRDLLITGDSVQATGSCDSFTVLADWQRLLGQMPGFDTIEIQDQKKDARTGQVLFTVSMTSTRMER
jgi:hypothetical protein